MTLQLTISLATQQLFVHDSDGHGNEWLIRQFSVSTAAKGAGEQNGSFQTPRGRHLIAEKIGEDAPMYAAFRGRKQTGEIWTSQLGTADPQRDWILSRILWLAGCEPGKNQGGNVDTQARYIYIHGTHAEDRIGTPCSHGCIRMNNADVIDVFDLVETGTAVDIIEQ